MKKEEKKELVRLLELFFDEVDLRKRDVLCKNEIAAFLKSRLLDMGFWRNKKRGKPNFSLKNRKSS